MAALPQGMIARLCRRIESGGVSALTTEERRVFAISWLNIEMNLGGFHQFFYNDAGKYASDALAGLRAIGAAETAGILEKALALFPSGQPPIEQNERREALAALPVESQWEYMSELTAQFFRSGDDLLLLLNDYIAANPDSFLPHDR